MMTLPRFLRVVSSCLCILLWFAGAVVGQTETATVSGLVTDRTAAAVSGAEVRLQSVERGTVTTTTTNDAGIYVFPSVHPGQYQVSVQKQGFKQIDLLGLFVNVQDHIEQNFRLQLGSVAESVTVKADDMHLNTTDATVSTVMDRQFAENLPMNGRSFQTLIQLAPGVVLTPSTAFDSGQFSINGQRADANYWTVDGVSANIGVSAGNIPGNGIGGAAASFSVIGGTNSLVSVDALQEFRIQTSTYAPEFGRTPGGQISILTRSGTTEVHGTVFEYFRNDVLDANNWFNTSVAPALPKAKERQNDFGGTFSGPILKDRTFFFFSYEGLRLRLPQTVLTRVPDQAARSSASAATKPYLSAFPLPNGADNAATGVAQFNASFSNPATLDAYSLRIDHKLRDRWTFFGRYNYSPSELDQRGYAGTTVLSVVQPSRITTQTATVGATWLISPTVTNDFRFNYSRADAITTAHLDDFGGAVPLQSLPFPSAFTSQNGRLFYFVSSLGSGLRVGPQNHNLQRQLNLVESASVQKGSHALKFGVDLRRLSPLAYNTPYFQTVFFSSVASASSGNLLFGFVGAGRNAALLFHNLGMFAQDTWRVAPRLSLTYGVRWDIDFAPSTTSGPGFPAVTGFNLQDFSALALAPAGTPPFKTKYGNVGPRVGAAYQFSQSQSWQTVFRAGFGMFFDLATSELGNLLSSGSYPFLAQSSVGGSFPLPPATAAPPPIVAPSATNPIAVAAFDPNLNLPYTLQWNVALEQALGPHQTISASYIGSAGKRLLQPLDVPSPSPEFSGAALVVNTATSNYNALQLQFQRRLSHGLQALASYTWAHSIDDGSAGSLSNLPANTLVPAVGASANRGPSDFDVRSAFSASLTYEIPVPKFNPFTNAILHGWSLQSVIQARTAPPVNVYDSIVGLTYQSLFGVSALVRPDVVPGIPLYLYGPQYPGGKAINNTPGAVTGRCPDGSQSVGPFCPPPTDSNGNPVRQGNLGRNSLRGFGATQWDFAVHRDFSIRESLKLQFRAEMFNVLNHPNFGQPIGDLSGFGGPFGISTQMLGQSLTGFGGAGGGALNPLYQIGGPRSIQLALKLTF